MKKAIWQLTSVSLTICPFHWVLDWYHDGSYTSLAFGPLTVAIGWPTVGEPEDLREEDIIVEAGNEIDPIQRNKLLRALEAIDNLQGQINFMWEQKQQQEQVINSLVEAAKYQEACHRKAIEIFCEQLSEKGEAEESGRGLGKIALIIKDGQSIKPD